MIRVAIADDSPFTCKLLASYLEENGECRVVGVAHDAGQTLDMVRKSVPDVLTLDLQMPGADGLELLRQVSSSAPVPVVVISGISRRAAATTLRALELGAVDFVLKYTHGAPISAASLKREIVTKVKAAAGAQVTAPRARAALAPVEPAAMKPARVPVRAAAGPHPAAGVIVIGGSTGGPRALGELLAELPPEFASCCVVVQHLPALFTIPFAEQLSRQTALRVQEMSPGDRLEPGRVFVTPGSVHVLVRGDGRLDLQQPSDRDRYRPSIDLAMSSAAESFGPAATGVILTGMGDDGAEGLKRIRLAGGRAYVQEPASSVMASMPTRALELAGADHVASPARIGQLLAARNRT